MTQPDNTMYIYAGMRGDFLFAGRCRGCSLPCELFSLLLGHKRRLLVTLRGIFFASRAQAGPARYLARDLFLLFGHERGLLVTLRAIFLASRARAAPVRYLASTFSCFSGTSGGCPKSEHFFSLFGHERGLLVTLRGIFLASRARAAATRYLASSFSCFSGTSQACSLPHPNLFRKKNLKPNGLRLICSVWWSLAGSNR